MSVYVCICTDLAYLTREAGLLICMCMCVHVCMHVCMRTYLANLGRCTVLILIHTHTYMHTNIRTYSIYTHAG